MVRFFGQKIKTKLFFGCLMAGILTGFAACGGGERGPLVLTREVENSEEYSGWGSREYHTGLALQEEPVDSVAARYILLEMYIGSPGRYYPWVLAALDRLDTSVTRQLKIVVTQVKAHSFSPIDSAFIDIRPTRALEWMTGGSDRPWIEFPEFGPYFITIETRGEPDPAVLLDQFLLTGDRRYAPSGYARVNDTTEIILPPAWAFGVLYGGYTDQEGTMRRVDSIIAADLPIDGYWVDSWFWDYAGRGGGSAGYIDFRGDTAAYPDPEAMWDYLERRQVKGGLWIWNALQQTGNEEVFGAFEERDFFDGVPSENTGRRHNASGNTLIGDIDFENPEAVAYWQERLAPLFEQGLDFLKLDRSSAAPFLQAAFTAVQEMGRETEGRGFILSHLHSTYDPETLRYPAKWTGDAKIAWTQPDYPDLGQDAMGGLRENLLMVADPRKATYAAPFLTHDAGGYDYFGSQEQSDTLYMRWIQFSMFNPVTTLFTSPANPTANLPYRYSPAALENYRFYSHLKLRLFPYIYTYAHLTRETRRKMVQGAAAYPDQYLFGRELLVAPVTGRGATRRNVYLPPGAWIDFYDHRLYPGDTSVAVDAPIDRLPLFVRAGSILPMRPYARAVERGSNDTLLLAIYPGPAEEGAFTLREDDGTSNDYRRGRVANSPFRYRRNDRELVVEIGKVRGEYQGMQPERTYILEVLLDVAPVAVRLNGTALPAAGWRYDAATRRVTIMTGALSKDDRHRLEIR